MSTHDIHIYSQKNDIEYFLIGDECRILYDSNGKQKVASLYINDQLSVFIVKHGPYVWSLERYQDKVIISYLERGVFIEAKTFKNGDFNVLGCVDIIEEDEFTLIKTVSLRLCYSNRMVTYYMVTSGPPASIVDTF